MSQALSAIMTELPEDFVRRMRNWARGKAGTSIAYASVRWDVVAGRSFEGAPMPILSGEANDTDRSLQALDVRYRRPVELFWSWEGLSLAALGRRCGGIDYDCYARRVMRGHDLLRAEIARQTAEWRSVAQMNRRAAQLRIA